MKSSNTLLITSLAALTIAGCGRDAMAPDPALDRLAISASVTPAPAPSSFYNGCVAGGTLSKVSDVGTAAATAAGCKTGRETAVVLRAGSDLNFCYRDGRDISDFTTGTASCKRGFTAGGFAAGTDLFGCLVKGSLTGLGAAAPACPRGAVVGLSFPRSYNVSVSVAGSGIGSVTSNPGGIDCPGTCAASLIENSLVTLTRNVGLGSDFGGWSDPSCTGATCAVILTADIAVTANFIEACTPSLSFTGPVVGDEGYAIVYRSADFSIGANLGGGCPGAWTYSWTYKLGDEATQPVPTDWAGNTSASLNVPKWTLEKFPTEGRGYVFSVTATPPAGSTLVPLSATVNVRVRGTVPAARFGPAGFGLTAPVREGYGAVTTDYDNPAGQEKLIYRWIAESDQVEFGIIAPFSGTDTRHIFYDWYPAYQFVTLTLTVCPSDEPYRPEDTSWPTDRMLTGCRTFSDNFGILDA